MTFYASGYTMRCMRKKSALQKAADSPEFFVTREFFNRYFDKPLPTSTFHDKVKEGKFVPAKFIQGMYMLNASLRRLGLAEMTELPKEAPPRSSEDIIRLAFHTIDTEVFPMPWWAREVEILSEAEVHHARLVVTLHAESVNALDDDFSKHNYLQGVLEAAEADRLDQS
jgi:hypothetical protein